MRLGDAPESGNVEYDSGRGGGGGLGGMGGGLFGLLFQIDQLFECSAERARITELDQQIDASASTRVGAHGFAGALMQVRHHR